MSKRLATLWGIIKWPFEPSSYTVKHPFPYFSPRYHRVLLIPKGFKCDGATWAPNLGRAWIVHDWMFAAQCWADGTPIKWREANRVMQDIMESEGWPRWVVRAFRAGIRTKWSHAAWKEKQKKLLTVEGA